MTHLEDPLQHLQGSPFEGNRCNYVVLDQKNIPWHLDQIHNFLIDFSSSSQGSVYGVEIYFQFNQKRTSIVVVAVQLPDNVGHMFEVVSWSHKLTDELEDLKRQISVVLDGISFFIFVFELFGTDCVEHLKMCRLVLDDFSGRF